MRVCTCVYIRLEGLLRMCVGVFKWHYTEMCVRVCVRVCVRACARVFTYVLTGSSRVFTLQYTDMRVCGCVCVCVCVCARAYVCSYTF